MAERHDLLAAVTALEKAFAASASLGDDNFLNNRKEVIRLRREIGARVSELSAVGAELTDKTLRDGFRLEFVMMRAALTLHYASWPVVAIELDNPTYAASIATMRAAYRRFISWARSH